MLLAVSPQRKHAAHHSLSALQSLAAARDASGVGILQPGEWKDFASSMLPAFAGLSSLVLHTDHSLLTVSSSCKSLSLVYSLDQLFVH